MVLTVEEISAQVSRLIQVTADLGQMLPKSPTEIEERIHLGMGFFETESEIVTAFAAFYDWERFLEIASVVTHPNYYGRGLAMTVTKKAINAARQYACKPVIALTNKQSTRLFERLGFVYRDMSVDRAFIEPCKQTCVDFGRYPACNCHFMILEDQKD